MFAPCADSEEQGKDHQESALLGPQHQTAAKGWGTWRDCKRKRKGDKALWELQRSLLLKWGPSSCWHKDRLCCVSLSLITPSKARQPWQREGSW